ncbi:DUF885 domain-containing protein [Ornithinimicrobium cerasi]|uniref:Uncharacterized conserved protein, DUF885 familyt n=1 Tax=Ornithinimicrobium cerasi TaxID=2248773 RepID=A0A285VEI6_9MICO|nr:DUF885 domain-containing protein [Ornithinimicrobium cerasi]SOC52514.1 Uncharacterized conserved protein, DUF885 familyt [Ornithinimicrobium cerasi]
MTAQTREQTDIDRLAEAHLDAVVALSPLEATYLGVAGQDHRLDDLSIEGLRALRAEAVNTLEQLARLEPVDDVDRVTAAALQERLGLEVESTDLVLQGRAPVDLNVIASPTQAVRDIFDIMGKDTEEQWRTVAARLDAVPTALRQYASALTWSAERGQVAPRRQVERVAEQCRDQAGDEASTFDVLLTEAEGQPQEVRGLLAAAVRSARAAFGSLATFLDGLAEQAPESDACGRELYQLRSRSFLGATIDLEETYRWGQEELARITAMMEETADRVRPGATVKEAVAILDEDPAYQLDGTAALKEWMQVRADEAVADLGDTHFDIPEPIRRIECMIAPSQTGGIYYTGPSEDFSRPGRMWWSVPKGVTRFSTWRELTTVYHEGVPGHHLQIGQTVYRSELLNRWRRLASWTSGHGEGWALYSEWLMADLGYMDDPGNRMGLLDAQSLRAARVVLDIGVHCGFEAPAEVGGGDWTYDKAWEFLNNHVNMDEGFVRFELDRYLGWPGQAPAYKVGERLWLELRDELRRREGESFDLKAFHRRALDVGGVGLDTLRAAVLGEL